MKNGGAKWIEAYRVGNMVEVRVESGSWVQGKVIRKTNRGFPIVQLSSDFSEVKPNKERKIRLLYLPYEFEP